MWKQIIDYNTDYEIEYISKLLSTTLIMTVKALTGTIDHIIMLKYDFYF